VLILVYEAWYWTLSAEPEAIACVGKLIGSQDSDIPFSTAARVRNAVEREHELGSMVLERDCFSTVSGVHVGSGIIKGNIS
jgi:hypothetical protein